MRIGIIGCGVVGAAIAFELSQLHDVTVWDMRSQHQWGATGAALGVLGAALSLKLKGKHLQLRLDSLKLFETLIPKLEALTGVPMPHNRQGILQLCFDEQELHRWFKTQDVRAKQGFQLEIWNRDQLLQAHPHLQSAHLADTEQPVVGAIYSPQDRQIDPVAFTQVLIKAAQINGAEIRYQTPVNHFRTSGLDPSQQVTHVCTDTADHPVDWLIVSAGLGSMPLTTTLKQTVPIYPVLGQALHLQRPQTLSRSMPVVNGNQIHIVPTSPTEIWVGATVEFPAEIGADIAPDPDQLQALHRQAIALDASLAEATVLRTWSGLRPRPHERPAPIIETLPGYSNIVLASGHYRNGVLLAPITAQKVRQLLSNSG